MKYDLSEQLNTSEKLTTKVPEIKPYNIGELANYYGVDIRTLKKWLSPFSRYIGVKRGRFFTVVQVERILIKIGLPKDFGDVGGK